MENSAPIVPEAPVRLWVPGLGDVDLRVRKVAKAVRDYDPSLSLARHEITGDWVVFIERGKGGQPFPVFGLGKELPRPEDIEPRLSKHDVARNGKKIMDDLARAAERKRKESEYRVSEENDQMSEHYAHAFRRLGAHPSPRIFVPGRGQ